MYAVVAVWRLTVWSVEFVRRIRHVAVRGPLVRLTSPPATQRFVGVIQPAAHLDQAPVSSLVEAAAGLGSPQLVFLGDQLFDLIEHGLLFHTSSIVVRLG